jgi:glutamate/aspartate transport system substrate-binding protein
LQIFRRAAFDVDNPATNKESSMRISSHIAAAALVMLTYNTAGAQNLTGTLQKAKETGHIVVGFQEGSIPFSYLDENQKPIGYTLDICSRIVDEVKKRINEPLLKVDYMAVTSANRIPLLLNGTIDMNCASTTNTADRKKQVDFANSHFISTDKFLAKKADGLQTLDDLKGKSVVTVSGSVEINEVNKLNVDRNLGMKVLAAKDQIEAFLMLETGRAQAYVMDDVQLSIAAARAKAPADYALSSATLSDPMPYGIVIRKDDELFKALANRVTAALYTSPEINTLYAKWFQSPVPPNGVNFNYPVDPILQSAFAHPSDSPNPEDYKIK